MDGKNNSWIKPQVNSNVRVFISEDLLIGEHKLQKVVEGNTHQIILGILRGLTKMRTSKVQKQ